MVRLDETDRQADVLAGEAVSGVLEEGGIATVIRKPLNILSENMTPRHWVVIAREIEDLLETEAVEGVLVLHGTDTMPFTSAALSFMLAGIAVPVVLTGSNRPPNEPESDADRNIADALTALRHLIPGVYLSFAGRPEARSRVHDGDSVRKVRGSGPAFASVGRSHVAEVDRGRFGWVLKSRSPEREGRGATERARFRIAADERVLRVDLHPGINLEAMLELLDRGGYRGVCLTLYPALTAPSAPDRYSVPEFARRCSQRDILLALTVNARPVGPRTHYGSKCELERAGAVPLPLIPETALVKVMWALGLSEDVDVAREVLGSNK